MDPEKKEAILDVALALAHVDGDRELLSELVTMFLEDYPRILEEIQNAVLGRDYVSVERGAHTLKGRLAFFGIEMGENPAAELETMARNKDLAGAWKTLEEIQEAMKRILPEFRALLQSPPPSGGAAGGRS